jgi:hypothetical protein
LKTTRPPAIPAVPTADPELHSFYRAIKENVELLTGQRTATLEAAALDSTSGGVVKPTQDAFSIVLTTPSATLPADSSGIVSSYVTAQGQLSVLRNGVDVTADCALAVIAQTNCTGTINTALGTPVTAEPKGHYRVTDLTEDAGVLKMQAVYGTTTLDANFTVSKSKQGTQGPPGEDGTGGDNPITLVLSNPVMVLPSYANGTVKSFGTAVGFAKVLDGSTDVTASAGVVFSISNSNVTATINTADNTPVSAQSKGYYRVTAMASITGAFTITATYDGKTLTQTATVTQAQGGFEIVDVLPNDNLFVGRMVYYTVDGKLYRYTGTAWTTAVPATDIIGQLVETQIANAAITTAKFASSIRPIEIVASLPAPGIAGRVVFLTADNKLYRDTGTAWTTQVLTTDLSGQILDAQIAAVAAAKLTGQIVASQISDASLTTAKFASGIEPVTVVTGALPTVKSTNTIFLTSNQKIYRWNGTAYVATVPTTDLSGTISDAQIAALAASKITGQLVASQITDASLTTAKFASGIEPVTVVTGTLPTVKSTNTIFLTSNGKLYRWNGTAYVATVATTDLSGTVTDAQIAGLAATKLTGQITSTQITDSSISTPKLAAGAVTAATIAAGTIQASNIAAGTITGDRIAGSTITATNIAADTITAGQIAAGAISTSELAAGAVTATKIAVGTITANEIAANTITGGKIAAATITGSNIVGATITAGNIASGTITGDRIAANTITGANIAADTITAGQIAAGAVTASELAAGAVTAGKLFVGMGGNNLVKNSSFENGWGGFGQYDNSAQSTASFVAGGGRNGGISYRLSYSANASTKGFYFVSNTGTDGNVTNNSGIFKAGRPYVFSWYAKATGASVGATMMTAWNLAPNVITAILNPPLTTDWQRYAFYLYWNPGTTVDNNGYASINGGNGVSTLDYDDVQVEEGEYPTAYAAGLLDGEVRGTFIADGAITTNKITANAITAGKIASGTITSVQIAADTITAGNIATGAITADELAAGSVIAGKVAAAAISTAELAAGAVVAGKIAAGTITSNEIASRTIKAINIEAASLTANEIAANTIITNNLAAGAVTAAKIASSTITALEIASGTITAAKIDTSAFTVTRLGMTVDITNARVQMFANSNYRITGVNFGAASNFVDYFGSGTAATASESNAKFFIKNDGSAMFAGRVRAEFEVKAWACIYGDGTPSFRDCFNTTSVTKLGVGRYRITFAQALVNNNYCCVVAGADTTRVPVLNVEAQATTHVDVSAVRRGNGDAVDITLLNVLVFGSNVTAGSNASTPTGGGFSGGTFGGGVLP